MNNKPALALDMDDLLFPMMTEFVESYNATHSTEFSIDDYFTFDFWNVWDCTPEEAFERVAHEQSQFNDKIPDHEPIEGAIEGVNELASIYRLFIVTSRPDEVREHTHDWIAHHFPNVFEDAILCNQYALDGRHKTTKGEVVEQINAVGLVDDSVKHIREVVGLGRRGIIFGDYAWNRERTNLDPNIQSANKWGDVVAIAKDWINK